MNSQPSGTRLPLVYLSFSSEGAIAAAMIRKQLHQAGLDTPNPIELGDDWEVSMKRQIREADAFIVLISSQSFASPGFKKELRTILFQAQERHRPVEFVMVGDVSPQDFDSDREISERLRQNVITKWSPSSPESKDTLRVLVDSLCRKVARRPDLFVIPPPRSEPPSASEAPRGEGAPPRAPQTTKDSIGLLLRRLLPSLLAWFRVTLAKLGLARPSKALPENANVDNVHFTITAPATFAIGEHAELMVWAHLAEQQRLVLRKAMLALGFATLQKLLFRSAGPIPVKRGTVLSLLLEVEGLEIANPHNHITWTGAIGSTSFVVGVPADAAKVTRKASLYVRINGFEIGRLDFVVRLESGKGPTSDFQADYIRYSSAFACYSSEDRNAVLAAIQGMQKLSPKLRIFLDVMKLRSGEDWQKKLLEEIGRAEVFFLFWCRHAMQSEWVEREWRFAYKKKGVRFIDPVPLEPAEVAPPPQELKQKHFNDPILAFMRHPD